MWKLLSEEKPNNDTNCLILLKNFDQVIGIFNTIFVCAKSKNRILERDIKKWAICPINYPDNNTVPYTQILDNEDNLNIRVFPDHHGGYEAVFDKGKYEDIIINQSEIYSKSPHGQWVCRETGKKKFFELTTNEYIQIKNAIENKQKKRWENYHTQGIKFKQLIDSIPSNHKSQV